MKVRILLPSLALILLSHSVQASPMPAGYGVGRANEGADQPAQVDYDAIVLPRAPGALQAWSQILACFLPAAGFRRLVPLAGRAGIADYRCGLERT